MFKIKSLALAAFSFAFILALHSGSNADTVLMPEEPQGVEAAGQQDEAPRYYTIVKGDTLWDISQKFLEDPFRWPKVWRLNPYIKNPHLIYPGNIVKITPYGIEIITPGDEVESLPVIGLEPRPEQVVVLEPPVEPKVEPPPPPAPRIKAQAMLHQGFITEDELKASGAIIAPREEKILMSQDDAVYLSLRNRSDVSAGDRFTVFKLGGEVKHPVTGKRLGYIVDILGNIEVTGTGEVVEGNIEVAYKEIEKGARLTPYMEPVESVEITGSGADVSGVIVASMENKVQLATGDVAYIDKGAKDGVGKGNLLRVYRPNKKVADPMNPGKKIQLPYIDLGTLIVVKVDEATSACVIMESLQTINKGDLVSTLLME